MAVNLGPGKCFGTSTRNGSFLALFKKNKFLSGFLLQRDQMFFMEISCGA